MRTHIYLITALCSTNYPNANIADLAKLSIEYCFLLHNVVYFKQEQIMNRCVTPLNTHGEIKTLLKNRAKTIEL